MNGCDSLVLVRTTLSTQNTLTITATVCAGDSARLFNRWYKTSGIFKDSVPGVGGCDSVVTLVLTVSSKSTGSFSKTICAGDSIKVGVHIYRSAGVYLDTLKNRTGCDSMVTTTVSIFNTDTTFLTKVSGSPLDTGLVKTVFKNLNGCDSLVFTHTTLSHQNDSTTITATVCAGDSARLFNRWYAATGVYKDSVQVGASDSVVTLILTVNPKISASFSKSICAGDSVKVGGHIYKTTGIYSDTLKNGTGCDSVVRTTVSIFKMDTTLISKTSCSPSDTGLIKTLLKNLKGCDSLVLTRMTLSTKNMSTITSTVCSGDSARLFNRWYKTTGVYNDSVPGVGGCDSVVTLILTVNPKLTGSFAKTICAGDSVKIGAHIYKTAGLYSDTLKSMTGCDSIISTNVSIFKTDTTLLTKISALPSDTGLVKTVFKNLNGCDSLVFTQTTLSQKNASTTITATVCAGDSARLFNRWYKTTGIYKDSVRIGSGDSVVTLILTVNSKISVAFSKEICAGDSVKVGAHNYTTAGIYSDTLKNGSGCDSVVMTTVLIFKSDTTLISKTSCLAADTGLVKTLLKNLNGCDSLVLTRTTLSTKNTSTITATVCSGDSARLFNRWYKTTGVYKDSIIAVGGCDSVVMLILTVKLKFSSSITRAICAGDSLKVGSHIYRLAGVYSDTIKNAAGCDSVIGTTVSVLKPDTTFTDAIACSEQDTGFFKTVFKNRNGCDSVVWTRKTLAKKDATVDIKDICQGDSLFFKNRWLKLSGVYKEVLMNTAGCDSAVELRLIVRARDTTLIEKTSCRMTEVGTSIVRLQNRFGCDSLVQIHTRFVSDGLSASLRVVKPVGCYGARDAQLSASRTGGGKPPYSFHWSVNAAGDSATALGQGIYFLTVADAAGCNAVDSVKLTQPAPLRAAFSAQPPICYGDSNGVVKIDSVNGGTAPYFVAFNGLAFNERINVLPFYIKYLKPGNYPVAITDSRQCIFRDTADVTTKPPLFVDMGAREERLILGDSVFLKPVAGFPIHAFQWSPADYLSCPTCLRGFAKPFFTTSYTLTLTDTAGCQAVGKITIFVDKPRKVFIPNAFSPNNDGQNDVLTILTGQEVALIKTFQIYDRWGEKVFEAGNAQPNDERAGWDGTFKGQPAPTGSYVYFAKIVFKDGVELMYQGDVNIVR